MHSFKVGQKYKRVHVLELIDAPKNEKGKWGGIYSTGYFKLDNAYYVFVNVGVEGRTGHNYDNKFTSSDELYWFAKENAKFHQNQIQELLNSKTIVHIFFREENRDDFIYAGLGKAIAYENSSPIQITWKISE